MPKCEHGKQKADCKTCGGSSFCEHDKRKSLCIECKGSQICAHNKRKSYCKECGGSAFCEHGKYKSSCRDCGGTDFCEHGKRKSSCKDCGGTDFCEHGKYKHNCRECGSSAFCEHDKRKSQCRTCGGSAFCEHGKIKSFCKDCKGSQICEHDKVKSHCRVCQGSAFCVHDKIKRYCIECRGSAICEHNKQRSHCKVCLGSAFCEHKKRKTYCIDCRGSGLCKTQLCPTIGNPKYNGYCLPCCVQIHPEIKVPNNYKTKENEVVDRIKESFPAFDWIADKKVQDGCSRRRPDLLLDMGTHIIIVEVDEHKHADYDCSCENKRLMELSQDLQHRPIVFIRFNPDEYTGQNGELVKSCWKLNQLGVIQIVKSKQSEWEERIHALTEQIQYWIDTPTDKTVQIIELFY